MLLDSVNVTLVTVETDVNWNVPEMVSVTAPIVTVLVSKVNKLHLDIYAKTQFRFRHILLGTSTPDIFPVVYEFHCACSV